MKKKCFFITLILTFALYSCNNPQENNSNNIELYSKSSFLYDTPSEFIEYLDSNSIDSFMNDDEITSQLYTTKEVYDHYYECYNQWIYEMDAVYESLMSQLPDEARNKLETSQKNWEESNKLTSELWLDIFNLSKGHGSGDDTMILIQNIDRVRNRTFLLAEYLYWLTGDFKFTYKEN